MEERLKDGECHLGVHALHVRLHVHGSITRSSSMLLLRPSFLLDWGLAFRNLGRVTRWMSKTLKKKIKKKEKME